MHESAKTSSAFSPEVPKRQTKHFGISNASRIRRATVEHERGLPGAPVIRTTYYNYMDRDIRIKRRDGTSIVVNNLGRYVSDEFVICISQSMRRDVMQRTLDSLIANPVSRDRDTSCWISAYEIELARGANNSYLTASVEYVIYHRDLVDAGGRCYLPDLDILMEESDRAGGAHPFERSMRDEAMLEAIVPGVGDDTFVLMIKAVDNSAHPQRGNRYVNIAGEIYAVPIERDTKYTTGIHLVTRPPVHEDGLAARGDGMIIRSYSFEEGDVKLFLHRSVEAARHGGPVNEVIKQLLDRESAIKRLEEAKLRTEQLEADAELQRLKNEGALHRAQAEKEASMRRNLLEWAKTAAALLGVALTIYGLASKSSSK